MLEEEDIRGMYWRLWLGGFGRLWRRLFPHGFSRSPWLVILIVAILVIGPGLAWKFHVKGRLRTVKRDLTNMNSAAAFENVGNPGIAPVFLQRAATPGSEVPEFTSATFLPGLGMSMLQITANLPGRGEISLMAAPTVKALATGTNAPSSGINDDFGAFEVPWGGQFMGISTPSGNSVMAYWKGDSIDESTDGSSDSNNAEGGNLRNVGADETSSTKTMAGMKTQAVFHGLNADGRWPSRTDVAVTAALSGQYLDLTVQAKNTGEHVEPLGIGWYPRFAVAPDRDSIELLLPASEVMETDNLKGLPTGRFAPGSPALSRFQGQPAPLGNEPFDQTLVEMKPSPDAGGPVFEIRNPAAGYGLRLIALSPAIRAVRVIAPGAANYVTIGMQTNLDDPLGKEWNDTGITAVEPGQTVEWKIRLEIFALPQP